METIISSKAKGVIISDKKATVLIGERINATRKKLGEALKSGNKVPISKEALAQVKAGADVLDVNACITGYDESTLLSETLKIVTDTVDVPLCLDSTDPKALEAALKSCQGKPMINSVTGEEHSLEAILPLAKQHGAAIIGLVIDDDGISNDPDRRVSTARKIMERAEAIGIPREDILIDCLVQSIGANDRAILVTLETIKKVKANLGLNTTIGTSNASFGLPDRSILNSTFIAMAIAAGVTCAMVDVAKIRPIVLAADLLVGRDKYAKRYIEAYRQRQKL
jgi:5-methyltetrahydrofolate--homocysteine methyltransferase